MRFLKEIEIYPLRLYFFNKTTLILFSLSLFINFLIWFWLFWQWPITTENIYLHYNVLFGVDKIGPSWHIFYLPVSGLVILVVNFLLGWLLFVKEMFVAQLLNFTAVFSQILLVIIVYFLSLLNL